MANASPSQDPQITEIDFGFVDFLLVLWRARLVFLVVLAASTVFAVVGTRMLPRIYKATCVLVFTEQIVPVEEEEPPSAGSAGEKGGKGSPSLSRNSELYKEFARSNRVMLDIIREFKLDQPPYHYNPDALRSRFEFEAAGGDRLFKVTFSFTEAEAAQKIANYMGDALVSTSRKIKEHRQEKIQEYLQTALATVKTKLDQTTETIEGIEKKVRYAKLKSDLETVKAVLEGATPKLNALGDELLESNAKLESVRSVLSQETPFIGKLSGPIQSPEAKDKKDGRSATSSDASQEETFAVLQDVINPTYTRAQSIKMNLEQLIAGLKARAEKVREDRDQSSAKLQALQTQVDRVDRELSVVKLQFSILSESYTQLSRKLEESRLHSALGSVPGVMVIDPALTPEYPLGINMKKNVMTADLFSFALTAMGVLVFNAVRRKRPVRHA